MTKQNGRIRYWKTVGFGLLGTVAAVALFFIVALSGTLFQHKSDTDPPFTLFVAIPLLWAGQAVVARYVAKEKGRSTAGWVAGVLLGCLCGVGSLIVLLILVFLPYVDNPPTAVGGPGAEAEGANTDSSSSIT